jgi:hypothetical protein
VRHNLLLTKKQFKVKIPLIPLLSKGEADHLPFLKGGREGFCGFFLLS